MKEILMLKKLEGNKINDYGFHGKKINEIIDEMNNEKKLIRDIVCDLIDNSITLILNKEEMIYDPDTSSFCEGWFDENELIVAAGQKTEDFILTLTHEYCHFRQWKENSKIYKKSQEAIDIMNEYINKKRIKSKETNNAINIVQKMELDCEQRCIEMIKNYNINYNINNCVQKANAYIYFYSVLKETGKWYNKAPFKICSIVDSVPIKFLEEKEYQRIEHSLKNDYVDLCYNSI
jgi:hypothetical protein